MSARTDAEVEGYLDQLRHALADLPAAEVAEIIQDLEPQLTELAGEPAGGALVDRLGTPAEYAAELRGAMEMPAVPYRPSVWLPRTVLWVLVVCVGAAGYGGYLSARFGDVNFVLPVFGLVLIASWGVVDRYRPAMSEVAGLPEVRWVVAQLTRTEHHRRVVRYLASLRPGWFLVRAGLVFAGALWVFRWFGWRDAWPEVVASLVAVSSIVAGYRAMTDRRWLWLSVPLTASAIGVFVRLTDVAPQLLSGDHLWYLY